MANERTNTKGTGKGKALHPKVAAAGLGSLVTTVLMWLIGLTGFVIPAQVVSAITGLVAIGFAYRAPQFMKELGEAEAMTGLSAVA